MTTTTAEPPRAAPEQPDPPRTAEEIEEIGRQLWLKANPASLNKPGRVLDSPREKP